MVRSILPVVADPRGSLTIQSTVDVGTTMRVTLPDDEGDRE
jgi:hypothetical protein